MPLPGADDGDLAARNVHNGKAWSLLGDDGQMVFSPRLFHALGGLPYLVDYNTDDETEPMEWGDRTVSETAVPKLTEEEEAKYRPLYNKLVAVDRVAMSFGKEDHNETLGSFQRRSKRCIRKIGHHVSISSLWFESIVCVRRMN